MSDLSAKVYFSRPVLLPDFSLEQQALLQQAKVLVIGAGGLACPLLTYLGGSGIGQLSVIDNDVVSASNLHRQLLYKPEQVGMPKVKALQANWQFPFTTLQVHQAAFSVANAMQLVQVHDVVVDTTDNFETRYLVNDACVLSDKPLVSASIFRNEGQLGVYNYELSEGVRSGTYRCIFPEAPLDSLSCAEAGVLAVTAGLMGVMQATEVIKVILRDADVLANRLLIHQVKSHQQRILQFERDEALIVQLKQQGLQANSSMAVNAESTLMDISWEELQDWLSSQKPMQLIDVREAWEHEAYSIGGLLLPFSEIMRNVDQLATNLPVVLYCEKGERSKLIQQRLHDRGFTNIINLKGGLKAAKTTTN